MMKYMKKRVASGAWEQFLRKIASKVLKKGKFWNQSGIRWGGGCCDAHASTRDDLTTYQRVAI